MFYQSNAIRTLLRNNLFFFSFSSLSWVSLRAKIFGRKKVSCKILRATQSLTENASEYTDMCRFYANIREWMKICFDARSYVEKYANVNVALNRIRFSLHVSRILEIGLNNVIIWKKLIHVISYTCWKLIHVVSHQFLLKFVKKNTFMFWRLS